MLGLLLQPYLQPPFHHHPRKSQRRRRKSAAAVVVLSLVVICSIFAVHTQAKSLHKRHPAPTTKDRVRLRRESPPRPSPSRLRLDPRNETLSYQVTVFLAQEEAKCLAEFGDRENKSASALAEPYNVPNPFTCSSNSPQSVSGAPTPGVLKCETCRSLTQSLRRSREECSSFCGRNSFCFQRCEAIRERSSNMSVSWLQGGGGAGEQLEIADAEPEIFVLEEPRVFCEDVVALGNGDASFHGPASYALLNDNARKRTRNDHEDEEADAYSPFPSSGNGSEAAEAGGAGIGAAGAGSHSLCLIWRLKTRKEKQASVSSSVGTPQQVLISASGSGSYEIPFPVVFLVEYQTPDAGADWILLGKRLSSVQRLGVPYNSRKYRWRVTAVGAAGMLSRAHSPLFYTTLDGFKEPGPPSSIFVAREIVNDASVDVLIGWEPPPERPCAYKINLYPMDTMEHYRTHRLTEPLGVNFHMFRGLKFGSKYDVTMTSRGDNWRYESTLKSQNFTTISCLEAHEHRFDKCDPPPPRNISHQLQLEERQRLESDEQQPSKSSSSNSKLDVKLSWLPPPYTSPSNPILAYTVSLGPPLNETATASNPKNILSAAFFRMNRNHNVPGNTTHTYLSELLPNTQYVVKLTATSAKGKSAPVQYHMSTKLAVEKEEVVMPQTSNWLYLSVSISCVILILFGCHFLRVFARKRKVKKARNQYFQTIEDRDAISADWSIVPLHDECYSLSEFSKEKWEISYDKIVMGDVIGQGAFGVVRRAAMARKNFLALAKKLPGVGCGGDVVGGAYEATAMETVAVKMLKVSATRDDRDQLIKEILTMQNLGSHAQIVSLLGACTKGRSLCLVMEFCPGGDLLTFLRKVRAKYWPTLGMVDSARSRTHPPLPQTSNSARTSVSSTRTAQKSIDSSPINYADLEVLSDEYSSSPTGDKHEYGNAPRPATTTTMTMTSASAAPGVDFEDEDCRPIDEKDVLCYARQIAMGMEYLEKNHIVHRDLACRNVLLLGDYKQVKLSDFGLSRDVYTFHVYHQKSNGKLPIKWMSIESIFTHVFTSKSDVWSYGILLWELVTLGGTPYPGLGNTELFQVLKSGYRMERPDNCSEELYALMKKCWRTAPASRPNFTELRRYVETMMDAAEPSLYLSLMADLPTDYFHINREDLLHSHARLDDEGVSGSKDSVSASNSTSNLKRSLQQQQQFSESQGESRKHAKTAAGLGADVAEKRGGKTKTSSTAGRESQSQPKPDPEATSYLHVDGESIANISEISESMSSSCLPSLKKGEEKGKTTAVGSLRAREKKAVDEEDEDDAQQSLIKSRDAARPKPPPPSLQLENNIDKNCSNGNGFRRPGSGACRSLKEAANSVIIIENKTYDLI